MSSDPAAPVAGTRDIRAAYSDESVAAAYIAERFAAPIGAVLHEAQVRAVRDMIARESPRRVLEIAPGPARVTVDVTATFGGQLIIVDTSAPMLAQARKRLSLVRTAATTVCVRGDAFAIPVASDVDLAYSFRLVRHFDAADRARIYGEIGRVLRPGGVFMFDAINREVAGPMRAGRSAAEYPIHDALQDPEELRLELGAAGFDVMSLVPVQKRYGLLYRIQILVAPRSRTLALTAMRLLERLPGGQPLEWVVCCRKRA